MEEVVSPVNNASRYRRNIFTGSPPSEDLSEEELTTTSSTAGRRRRRFSNPFSFDSSKRQQEGKSPNNNNRRSSRRQQRNTMDSIKSDIVKKGEPHDDGDIHHQEENHRKSLLMRFLARTSRRRSQTQQNSGGSTVSRLTDDEPDLSTGPGTIDPSQPQARRTTMDLDLTEEITPSSVPPIPPSKRDRPRRATMDNFGFSGAGRNLVVSTRNIIAPQRSKSSELPSSSIHSRDDYNTIQADLQKKADDLHKGGQLSEAIDVWVESLELAEANKDTLAKKMEVLCILVDLHLQIAQQQEGDYAPTDDPEEAERLACYHRQAAKRYVHRLKPVVVKSSWLGPPSSYMMDFLCEAEAWELALLVAEKLEQEDGSQVEPQQLATMHFQVASHKLDRNRQGEALQHLQATVEHLKSVSVDTRDMTMYMQVLQLLATEYNSQKQYKLALDAYEEQLQHATAEKQASLYCQIARIYISMEKLDLALEKLQLAGSRIDMESSGESALRFELLQTKGDVCYRLGRMEESLEVYEQALKEATGIQKNPAETAKLLYTLGRLCVRLRRIRPAISYYSRELEITIQELGMNHLSVSRILHEIAKLYDDCLGEPKTALMKLNRALSVELSVLQECHFEVSKCPNCNHVTHRMCSKHAQIQHDVSAQIRETKKCQGRIHFKLGNFEKALKTSFDEKGAAASEGAGPRR